MQNYFWKSSFEVEFKLFRLGFAVEPTIDPKAFSRQVYFVGVVVMAVNNAVEIEELQTLVNQPASKVFYFLQEVYCPNH
jgi:hypothetical protein